MTFYHHNTALASMGNDGLDSLPDRPIKGETEYKMAEFTYSFLTLTFKMF